MLIWYKKNEVDIDNKKNIINLSNVDDKLPETEETQKQVNIEKIINNDYFIHSIPDIEIGNKNDNNKNDIIEKNNKNELKINELFEICFFSDPLLQSCSRLP